MNELEIAYLAGIVDGEGCISLGYRRKKGKPYITPTLQITNTNFRLLDILKPLGGSWYKVVDKRTTRKDTFLWRMAGKEAKELVALIRPFLKLKTEQADIVINLPRHKTVFANGRTQATMTESDFQENIRLVTLMRSLNSRGKQSEFPLR